MQGRCPSEHKQLSLPSVGLRKLGFVSRAGTSSLILYSSMFIHINKCLFIYLPSCVKVNIFNSFDISSGFFCMYNAILANVDLLKLRNTELMLVFTASFHPAYQDLLLKHIPSLFSGVG